MSVKHPFASGKSDPADSSLVRPSNWNADHTPDSWEFLGRVALASPAAILGPLVIVARKRLMIEVYIAGYASTGIARLLFGGGAIDTTGANYFTNVGDDVAAHTSVNRVGIPVAQTAITGERLVTFFVMNQAARQKILHGRGISGAASATPTFNRVGGRWTNTADQILRVQLNSYATLTAESAVNLNAGTELIVWGRDDN